MDKPSLNKYLMSNFALIYVIFENNKSELQLDINDSHFICKYANITGMSEFHVENMNCDPDD